MRSVWVLVVLLVMSARADADDAKPWAAGVSPSEQATALAIYRDGNAEFEESRYGQALAKYREALGHWDHPAIRFNMAVSLVNLDQPLEAYEDLEVAMKFGAAPLGADGFAQAVTYKKLLDGQVTHLRVTSDIAGAEVTLDGKPLLAGPGEAKRLMLPGPHQIVATKRGFATETASIVLVPGKEYVHAVKLSPIATRLVRRWSARSPWIVAGVGAAVALIGGAFELQARSDYQSYDDLVSSTCKAGCGATVPGMPMVSDSLATKAHLENIAGVSLVTIGGAVAVAGLVGVYLNLPRPIVERAPIVTPVVGPNGAGALATWTF